MMQNIKIPLVLIVLICMFSTATFADSKQPIQLWEHDSEKQLPKLTLYPVDNSKTCVIVCPGGGYGGHAIQAEGYGIAEWLNKNGISAAVLAYRLPKGQHEIPLSDAKKAIQTLRSVRSKHNLNFHKLGVLGFSAGGHLAASTMTLLSANERPDFGILIYPVISFGAYGHRGSRNNLLGELSNDPKWIQHYSLENKIDTDTPPTFLAHAKDDKPVPIENSKMFYNGVKLVQPKSKFLILEQGGHGLNGYKGPSWDAWQSKSLKWISSL